MFPKLGKETIHEATHKDRSERPEGREAHPWNLVHGRKKNIAKVIAIVGSAAVGILSIWRPDLAMMVQTLLSGMGSP